MNPSQIKSWEELEHDYKALQSMPLFPNMRDEAPENLSLWNEEQLRYKQDEYLRETEHLYRTKEFAKQELTQNIQSKIMNELGDSCTLNEAKFIWKDAQETASKVKSNVMDVLQEQVNFVKAYLSVQNDYER